VEVTLGVMVELPDAVKLLLGDEDDVELPVFVTDAVCRTKKREGQTAKLAQSSHQSH
jgi:hypothetical protein